MKIILGDRASGKSTEAVEWLVQDIDNRVVVVAHVASVTYLISVARNLYPNLQVDWRQKFVSAGAATHLRGRRVEVMVDEVDAVLGFFLGQSVSAATMTPSELELL